MAENENTAILRAIDKGDARLLAAAWRPGVDANVLRAHAESIRTMLTADNYIAFRWASANGHSDTLRALVAIAKETFGEEGSKDVIGQMLAAIDERAVWGATDEGHSSTLRVLAAIAKETFGEEESKEMVHRMLEVNNYDNPFCKVAGSGHSDILRVLVAIARETFGEEESKEVIRQMLAANRSIVFTEAQDYAKVNGNKEAMGYLLSLPAIPDAMRELAVKRDETDNILVSAGFALPDPAAGRKGEVWPYGAFLDISWKIEKLREAVGADVHFNLARFFGNHKLNAKDIVHETNGGIKVDWDRLSQALGSITYKQIDEAGDTFREVSAYMARYMLAYQYIRDGKQEKLVLLSKEDLAAEIAPLRAQVERYFIEGKTLTQIVQMSNQWHKLRASLVKTKKDGSTLRDFVMQGSWQQTLVEKEVHVKEPGLEGYSVVNLTDAPELDEEGKKLKHCVSGYLEECKKGYQIFSIRKNGEPQTTMGFKLVDGTLVLDQNLGFENRDANAEEKRVEAWFLKGIKDGTIETDFEKTGEIPSDKTISEFENDIGIKVGDITTERLNANLRKIMGINRGNIYMMGRENIAVNINGFISNMAKGPPQQKIAV